MAIGPWVAMIRIDVTLNVTLAGGSAISHLQGDMLRH
jgi:hypothetical protein